MDKFLKPSEISENTKEFTKLMRKIKEISNELFPSYSDEYGIKSNVFADMLNIYSDVDFVEYDKDDIELVYNAIKHNLNLITRFFEMTDYIYLTPSKRISIAKSNNKDIAKTIIEMEKLIVGQN